MKPRLLYHPRTIGQAIQFALLGVRAAVSAVRWLFLRFDEAQLANIEAKNETEFARASLDLAEARLAIAHLESARMKLLGLRRALLVEGKLNRRAGEMTPVLGPRCGKGGSND